MQGFTSRLTSAFKDAMSGNFFDDSSKTKRRVWGKTLKGQLESVYSSSKTNLVDAVKKLRILKSELTEQDGFRYRSKEDEEEGRGSLLKLMQYLVEGIVTDSANDYRMLKEWEDRELWFKAAAGLFERREFDLERVGFRVPRAAYISTEVKKQFSTYRWLLIVVLNHARTSFRASQDFLDEATEEKLEDVVEQQRSTPRSTWKMKDYEMKFFMKILSIAYFRVPLIQGYITNAVANALSNTSCAEEMMDSSSEEEEEEEEEKRVEEEGKNDESSTKKKTKKKRAPPPPLPKDQDQNRDDIDKAITALKKCSVTGRFPPNGMWLLEYQHHQHIDDDDDNNKESEELDKRRRAQAKRVREKERLFCDCSPSLFDWINFQSEDHKRLLNAQECAIERARLRLSSSDSIMTKGDFGWDWLDLVVRNGECFALFVNYMIRIVNRHAGGGLDPVRAARHEAERKPEKFEDKITNGFKKSVSFFGSNLKRLGGMIEKGVTGGDKKSSKRVGSLGSTEKNSSGGGNRKKKKPQTPMSRRAMARERLAKRSMPDSVEVVWHCIPSYFHILKLFARLLHKMTSKPRDTKRGISRNDVSNSTIHLKPVCAKRYANFPSSSRGRKGSSAKFNVHKHRWPHLEATPRCVATIIDASRSLLSNPHLLDLFVRISFSSTSMFDFRSVEQCLDRLGKWIHTSSSSYLKIRSRDIESRLGLYEKLICMGADRNTIEKIVRDSYPYPLIVVPPSFDEDHFLAGLNLLLRSEHANTLNTTLRCLYQNMDYLSDSTKNRIMDTILHQDEDSETMVVQSIFIRLFCCWYEDVRRVFQHLLVYKVFRTKRTYLGLLSDKLLLGSTKSDDNVLYHEKIPDEVKQAHYLANDRRIGFQIDWFLEQLVRPRGPTPRRKGSLLERTSPHKQQQERKKKERTLCLGRGYYVYGKKSLKEYTQVLVDYYTRSIASKTGMVKHVEMAELVFGNKRAF
jgi:hypothetical protein